MTITVDPTPIGKSFNLISTFTPDRSNYISLPNPQVFNPAEAIAIYPSLKYFVFKASWSFVDTNTKLSQTKSCYLSWAGTYTQASPNVVSIPSHLGDSLKIPRGTIVSLQLVVPPSPVSFISLKPTTVQDYTITELNGEYITDNLLSLVSLVNLSLPLRLWVRGSLVTFTPSLIADGKTTEGEEEKAQHPFAILAPNTMVEIVKSKKDASAGASSDSKTDAGTAAAKKAKSQAIPWGPKFPNILVTIVPLPSSSPVLTTQRSALKQATKAASKQQVKDNGPQALAPSPLSSHLKTSKMTNSFEEPDLCDGTIYVSAELYQMLGFNAKTADYPTKPSENKHQLITPSSTIIPIAVLRTDRSAKPSPNRLDMRSTTGVQLSNKDQIHPTLPNQDPLHDSHMSFPTPIEPFFNNVVSVSKIKIHPQLKGFVVALHTLQRHALLLPSHSQIYISPYHPYLAQSITNTTLLPFVRPSFRMGFSLREPQLDENDYAEDVSILRLTYVPPSNRAKKLGKETKSDPLSTSLISLERQQVTTMDYKALARPSLRLRHIQFCLKSHIEGSEPLQLPMHWIELSFFMYLSQLFETNGAKLIKKQNGAKDQNGIMVSDQAFYGRRNVLSDYLVFGPSSVISIPLFVSTERSETQHGLASTKDCSLFSYQRLGTHCYRQIPTLSKNKPKGGYRGQYPHYITHRNKSLIEATYSDDEEESDEDDDVEEEDQSETKTKNPKTNHPVETLFWYTGINISLLVGPPHDSQRMANFVTVQVHQIEHQPFESTPDEQDTLDSIDTSTNTDDEKTTQNDNTNAKSESQSQDESKNETETEQKNVKTEKKTGTKQAPIVSVFLTCSSLSPHPTISKRDIGPQLSPFQTGDILSATAEGDQKSFIPTQTVQSLPSNFKVSKISKNKYLYQEEESDADELMNDDYTAENQLKKRREKALARKVREQREEDQDEDDADEDADEDYDEDYDEDDDEDEEHDDAYSPMNKLLGKFSQTAPKAQKQAIADPASITTAATRAETKKHNHANITDDDLDWNEEDHKEEWAYYKYLSENKTFSDDESENDFDPDEYQYDDIDDCYFDVYGNMLSVDQYDDLCNGGSKSRKVFTYTQRYRMSTPTQILVQGPLLLPQLTTDTWQTFCPPSGNDEEDSSRSVQTKQGGDDSKKAKAQGQSDPNNIQTAAAKMMQGQMPGQGGEEEEEEPPDPAVLEFMATHSRLLLQQPYMLTQEQFQLLFDHIDSTVDHLDVSLSLGFPFNPQVFSPSIQNPQVLHIPSSPLAGKAYIEALPSTTFTNGDSTEPNPITIASPISTNMYEYLSRYPYSQPMLQWFDSLSTALSLLQPYYTHLKSLSPYVSMQLPDAYNPETKKHTITGGQHNSTRNLATITTPQVLNATNAKASIISMDEVSKSDKLAVLRSDVPQLGGLLTNVMTHGILYGSNKSGKTTSICYLAHILSQHPSINAHIAYIDCTPYEEASVQLIELLFNHIFLSARLKHAPTILILDNLHIIAHPEKEHEDNSLMEAVVQLLIQHHHLQLQDRSAYPTIFLATAPHAESLNPVIVQQLFPLYSTSIEPPSYNQRQFVLLEQLNSFATTFASRTTKQTASDRDQRQLDIDVLQTIINNSEGYTFPDMTLLTHKIVNHMTLEQQKKIQAHIKMLRQSRGVLSPKPQITESESTPPVDGDDKATGGQYKSRWGLKDITSELITKLTSSYVPLSLRGIGLSKPPTSTDQKRWFDVGALAKVIQTLRQTFEYPVLYPQLFNNSPLKLISGALVYGAPGSGKSLLATALQFSCPKLHFIRVKGPEVLDKYVGASEDNVRKIFASARAARPCVIFFDDFDSIALKRGSDSNGVTDRVVNQLLVEMDGVKGREGVFVLAATTHPELIDSALLRPGRLDLQLYCPLPESPKDRELVLRSVSGCNIDYKPKGDDQTIVDGETPETETTETAQAKSEETKAEPEAEANAETKSEEPKADAETEAEAEPVEPKPETSSEAAQEADLKPEVEEDNKSQTDEKAPETAQDQDESAPAQLPTKKKVIKKDSFTAQPPVQGAADYVYNNVTTVRNAYQKVLDQHNLVQGHDHTLDTPHGRAIAVKKYKHRFPYVMADDVDFNKIAKLMKNFTGADITALLTNAMLYIQSSGEDSDDDDDEEGGDKKDTPKEAKKPVCEFLFHLPILTTELLIQGYNMTPISLPESDRKKFTESFKKFIQDKDQPESMKKFDPKAKGRVAMAP